MGIAQLTLIPPVTLSYKYVVVVVVVSFLAIPMIALFTLSNRVVQDCVELIQHIDCTVRKFQINANH